MTASKWLILSTLFFSVISSCTLNGQEQKSVEDAFAEFDNPFRSRPADETPEQRALALLNSQKYEIELLKASLQERDSSLNAMKRRAESLQHLIYESVKRQFHGSVEEQTLAIHTLGSLLKTSQTENPAEQIRRLDASIEGLLEQAFSTPELQIAVTQLFQQHLTAKGITLGFQPGDGNWRPVSDATQKEFGKIRTQLSAKMECEYHDFFLVEILDELSVLSGVEFQAKLSEEQKFLEVTYVSREGTFERTLSDILNQHDLDYRVEEGSVVIGETKDKTLYRSEVFAVRGLLSNDLDVTKLVALIKTDFPKQRPEFHLINKDSFAVVGTETQIKKVSQFLGRFPLNSTTHQFADFQPLHPAAITANQVVNAIHARDLDGLAKLATVSDHNKDRFIDLVNDVEDWFEGITEISELRSDGQYYFAKVQSFGDEVLVIKLEQDKGSYVLSDLNSPSVADYQTLKLIPIHSDKN